MDTNGFAQDPERRERWEALLAQLERVRGGYLREATGRLGLCFASMAWILAALCTIARLHGQGVTAVMSYSPPTDERGTDGSLSIMITRRTGLETSGPAGS